MFYHFDTDLQNARETEKEVATLFSKIFDAKIEFCKTNSHDLEFTFNGKIFRIEIKEDFKAKYTGNVAVEFECRGKPSGISTTNATHIVYKIHENEKINYYIAKTDTLKTLIENTAYHKIVSGGDIGSNSKCYLFYLHTIKENMFNYE